MIPNLSKSSIKAQDKSLTHLYRIRLLDAAAVDWDALREAWASVSGATLNRAIPTLDTATDKAWHTVDCKGNTVTVSVAPGEAPANGVATVSGVVEGINETTLAWAYDMQGREVVAVIERCADGKQFIFANPCTGGVTFQYQTIGSQDGNTAGISFNLTGIECPKPMLVYAPASGDTNDEEE